jgi:uncharacterized protein YjiS (DUF1127 family)
MSYHTATQTGAYAARTGNGLLPRLLDSVGTMYRRSLYRHHLRELDDRLLADIGLSRRDVEREAGKPFWKA